MTREEKLRSVFPAQHGTIEVPWVCRHQECGNSGFATEFVCQDDDDEIGIDSDVRVLVKRCNGKSCAKCKMGGMKCTSEFIPDDRDPCLSLPRSAINNKDNAYPFVSRTSAKKYNPPFV